MVPLMAEKCDPNDHIRLSAIQVSAHIGVPEEERALPQALEVDLTLFPTKSLQNLGDDLSRTIDYHAVWQKTREIGAERPRKLIETLAGDLAEYFWAELDLARIEVTVRKFILPGTGSVSVTVSKR